MSIYNCGSTEKETTGLPENVRDAFKEGVAFELRLERLIRMQKRKVGERC